MPTPIIESIAVAMQSRLLTITQDNQYNVDIADVIRPQAIGLAAGTPRDRLAVLFQLEPEEDLEKNSLGGNLNPDAGTVWKHWIQPFAVALYRMTDEKADPPVAADTLFNEFRADVERALLIDASWGGLVYATFIRPPIPFTTGAGSAVGLAVIVEVSYRTLETDPSAQAPA